VGKLEEIFAIKTKPKELTLLLAKELLSDETLLGQMMEYYEKAKDSGKGTCMAALTEISKEKPKAIEPFIGFIISQINHNAPRVKWESSQVIANMARDYPEQAKRAIPMLLENINDEGTVVKWSAAFALTEIAKSNPETQKQLLPIFREIIGKEENNGVRNIYVKAMKKLEKGR
jgi:hypothetical protein